MKRRTECVHIDPELIKLADALRDSIQKCAPSWMAHPTANMTLALEDYEWYKKRNNVL